MKQAVTAIFDIGKTNKKFFLFDADLNELHEDYTHLPETQDDEGFACDDLDALRAWMREKLDFVLHHKSYRLEAVNFSTYGATLVHLDAAGNPLTPLYNYLKPLPEAVETAFFAARGDKARWEVETASPALGMLNSGLQLYWLKHVKPALFTHIRSSLHFPQYCAFLLTGQRSSEYTSIGCHTGMWDYARNRYHHWLEAEGLRALLPDPIPTPPTTTVQLGGQPVRIGTGIHDSSAALIPYFRLSGDQPFLLLSTGTWSIALNPFNEEPLTVEELERDCLNYLRSDGRPVKAARLFLGNEYKIWSKKLAAHFGVEYERHRHVRFDRQWYEAVRRFPAPVFKWESIDAPARHFDAMPATDLSRFDHYEMAYHSLLHELTDLQCEAIALAVGNPGSEGRPQSIGIKRVRRIYLDGGFVDNEVFIEMLQMKLADYEVIVSQEPLGSAKGAAMVMS